ncbi:MAG TPA: DUF5683 domain-containing protein [Paludibacteraceae bacterium]|nr:DUF5683 domain-containing protein [Paludibacteraceae bacterium]HQB68857.1 DUF5683 domain-containing protein [Paludibacteraceae bacterium]HRS68015.1 DUF5683 domain-containing protein [Paludibacteraceae bacterium]
MKRSFLLIVGVLLIFSDLWAEPTDSIRTVNTDTTSHFLQTEKPIILDSLTFAFDSLEKSELATIPVLFKPDPQKSLWYALICPGLGQIYNRQYWKVPIVYGGVAAFTYAISWNGKYYRDYSRGYRDIMDSDPTTTSYENLLPYSIDPNSNEAKNLMRNRQNTYRRYRDLSIVGAVVFYAITVVDAYVDAQLADFDISPDLSMQVGPALFSTPDSNKPSVGVQFNFNLF